MAVGSEDRLGRIAAFSGVAGLIFLVFGLVCTYVIENDIYKVTIVHFIFAAALILFFFLRGGIAALSSKKAVRTYSFSAGVFAYGLVFVGILGLVNYLIAQGEIFQFDSTEENVFSLSPQTKKVVSDLDKEITIRAFYLGGLISDTSVQDTLERIVQLNDKLKLRVIDPEKQLIEAEKFGISENGTLHFSFSDQSIKRHTKIVDRISEQEIVNALHKLIRTDEKRIYYLAGHGEPDLASDKEDGYLFLKEAMEGENLRISKLILAGNAGVPKDASALIVAAPKRPLLENEISALKSYLNSGGDLIAMVEPRSKSGLRELLKPFGIIAGEDVIIEPLDKLFGGGLGVQPLVQEYGGHVITKGFTEGTLFSIASSVQIESLPKGSSGAELAKSSSKGWAEKNITKLFDEKAPSAEKDPEDIIGPVSIAAAVEVNQKAKEGSTESKSRIVVFGDSDFVNNVSIRQLYNRDFFLNSLNWVLGEESRIALRPKSLRKSLKGVSAKEFTLLFLFTGILLPELVVLSGFFIYFRRK